MIATSPKKWVRPEGITTASNDKSVCPVCKGTGWERYISWDTADVYGEPYPCEFARHCTKCSGIKESIDKTEVPPMYREADITKFKFDIYQASNENIKKVAYSFMNKFEMWEKEKRGLYLWSTTPGSGKTFLACCLGKSVMLRTSKQIRFITAPDYISRVGDSYKRPQGAPDPTWIYRNCDLLILDDIGVQKSGEWQEQELFRLIDERLNNGLMTIFTSNNSVDGLKIEERTKNRIQKSTVQIHMPEESIRSKKAHEEQADFLAKVLG